MLTWSPWRKQSRVSTSVTDGCCKILVPFSISDLEHINLQNTSQTRVCTLDIEKNGNLFFHGYEIDPDMEYLYASECHIDNKYCCIIRTEIQYFVFSECLLKILGKSLNRPGESIESIAKYCRIENETVMFDLEMMGLQHTKDIYLYQELFCLVLWLRINFQKWT